jgi:tetratricopeptide (TPR) repeat protein
LNTTTVNLHQARALAERGQVSAARAAYKALLAGAQKDARLLTEVGVFEAAHGEIGSARRHLEKALKINPSDPDVHFNLAELARQTGAVALAERHYRRTVALVPNHADALYGLGEALRLLGKTEEALPHLIRAHELQPQDPEILNCLGISLEENGHVEDAEQAFRRARAAAPTYHDARGNLAALLAEREDYEGANEQFSAIPMDALPAEMLGKWAHVLYSLRRLDEAERVADRALALDPKCVQALDVKASVAQRYGRFDECEQLTRLALKLDPRDADGYQRLSTIRRLGEDSIRPLQKIMQDEKAEDDQRATAGFALYSVLDRAGRYDEAFEALAQANAIRAKQRPYRAETSEQMAARTIATFDRAFLESRRSEGLDQDGPIFILGMPRSGTTLVEQILAAYPQVHAAGERNDLTLVARGLGGYPEQVGIMSSHWALETAQSVFAAMREGTDKPFATNKAPGNYLFIGLIAWLFPKARIVHCTRDPMDNGFSCFEQNFALDITFSTGLESFAHAYHLQEQLMAHWHQACPIPIHTVRYEDMVSDPEPHARALVDYIGLDWDPACLDTSARQRAIDTASVWQARQPINTGSVGKWRRYERHLAPLVHALKKGQS